MNANQREQLAELAFRDLYLAEDWIDIRTLDTLKREAVTKNHASHGALRALYQMCHGQYQAQGPEFALDMATHSYRVTVLESIGGGSPIFVLRRREVSIRDFEQLPIPRPVKERVLELQRGLILIVGSSGHGKTSTLVSLLARRLSLHGDIALAVEDPTETLLDGLHESGRCIQIATSRDVGYREPLLRALRAGIDQIMVGEIRDSETARQVVEASINGHLILSTLHAGTPADAVERLATLTANDRAYRLLAEGLGVVAHQRLSIDGGGQVQVSFKTLVIDDKVKQLIRAERIGDLMNEVDRQAQQYRLGGGA
ncbi:ATPase, T2SS/T4P/T4SS family [Salinicola endophyticus]|uniref:ATPase, T2SS/T4P/T4SS family n=1 Tax=Salinicola endophyticus TaxID=1949083 RepID=A0AB74UGZ2_9GAMM